jgi:hypothetical protein
LISPIPHYMAFTRFFLTDQKETRPGLASFP